jgi:hypothetical protein
VPDNKTVYLIIILIYVDFKYFGRSILCSKKEGGGRKIKGHRGKIKNDNFRILPN